jgi:hypothetical protein
MELVEGADTIPTLTDWIRDIQGRNDSWVLFTLVRRKDPKLAHELREKIEELSNEMNEFDEDSPKSEKEREELKQEVDRLLAQAKDTIKSDIGNEAFSHVLVQESSVEKWLNPAEAAFLLLEKTYEQNEGMIYVYGNHDNYLIDKGLCGAAKISPRRRYYEVPGVFMEHGHRMEATFAIGHPVPAYNYDGTRSGYKATIDAYHDMQKGSGKLGDIKKWAAGKWAQWGDQPQYWGEFAQVWLGRKSRNQPGLKPPHIFVIGHTHLPVLYQIDIDAWRIGGEEELPPEQETTETLITYQVIFQRYPGSDSSAGIADVPYTLKVDGQVVNSDKTPADGSVTVQAPAGKTAVLEIFGSQYELSVKDAIEPLDTRKGVQRRLSMLGYYNGNIEGIIGKRTDEAILNFQADNALDTDGIPGRKTRGKLRDVVGE